MYVTVHCMERTLCTIKACMYVLLYISPNHRVPIFTRDETGSVYLPTQLDRTLQLTGDGKCNKRGWACIPHPRQPRPILPSWLKERQKADVTNLCTLWSERLFRLASLPWGWSTWCWGSSSLLEDSSSHPQETASIFSLFLFSYSVQYCIIQHIMLFLYRLNWTYTVLHIVPKI
jgi:hypothetical protein